MSETIELPESLKQKVVEAMVDKLVSDGLSYNLREQIENKFKAAIEESGLIDELAGAVIERVLTDKERIIAAVADAMIDGICEVMARAYKTTAKEITQKIADTRW